MEYLTQVSTASYCHLPSTANTQTFIRVLYEEQLLEDLHIPKSWVGIMLLENLTRSFLWSGNFLHKC